MKTTWISLIIPVMLIAPGSAQEQTGTPPEFAAAVANARAYEEAYVKGDAAALAAFFTEDADYTSDDGRNFQGREAIEACLRDAFRVNKGARLSILPESVKVIAPDVVAEKGSTLVVSKSGEETYALYTAVHVRKDGAWKISQLVETPMPDSMSAEKLSELSWLIGEWKESDTAAGITIHSRYQWARGGNFITRTVQVKRGDEALLEGWQIIGWDPVEGGIRSWTFDDGGGHSDGRWTREGRRWLVRESGFSPDGSRTSADQTITWVSDDKFYWESANRTVDGDPQPGIGRIEIERVKGGE